MYFISETLTFTSHLLFTTIPGVNKDTDPEGTMTFSGHIHGTSKQRLDLSPV